MELSRDLEPHFLASPLKFRHVRGGFRLPPCFSAPRGGLPKINMSGVAHSQPHSFHLWAMTTACCAGSSSQLFTMRRQLARSFISFPWFLFRHFVHSLLFPCCLLELFFSHICLAFSRPSSLPLNNRPSLQRRAARVPAMILF